MEKPEPCANRKDPEESGASTMEERKENKHAQKTRETRERLLRAAEEVFVRDGYAGAELGRIATLAGRTKGAIYAQFKSKEEIFLALIEERAAVHRKQMAELISEQTTLDSNLQAMRGFAQRVAADPTWALLFLEFKLYSLRHPELRERMRQYFQERILDSEEEKYARLLGSPQDGPQTLRRVVAVQSLTTLASALACESAFQPGLFDEDARNNVVDRVFDALLLPECVERKQFRKR